MQAGRYTLEIARDVVQAAIVCEPNYAAKLPRIRIVETMLSPCGHVYIVRAHDEANDAVATYQVPREFPASVVVQAVAKVASAPFN